MFFFTVSVTSRSELISGTQGAIIEEDKGERTAYSLIKVLDLFV